MAYWLPKCQVQWIYHCIQWCGSQRLDQSHHFQKGKSQVMSQNLLEETLVDILVFNGGAQSQDDKQQAKQ